MDRAGWLTRQLKNFDRELYCEKSKDGKLCVFRNSKRFESFLLDDGSILTVARSTPYFVLALTHNWQANGTPVEWGYLPIRQRLQEIDLWKRDLVSEMEANEEKRKEAMERESRNKAEAFFSDQHSRIKKSFSDIRTCNMDMKKDRRRKKWA